MESDGLPTPRRYWALVASATTVTMSVLDGTIATVALPTIARTFDASPADSIWVVNAYNIAVTVSLLPLASLGEIFGYKRIYQASVVLFTLASLGCALATSLPMLILARALQGFAASGIMAMNSTMIRFTYPRAMLGRGIGYNAVVVALGSAAGPSVAAGILAVAPWPWLFAINVPLGIIAFLIGVWSLPSTPAYPRRFDMAGALLNAVTFGALFLGVERLSAGESPWASLATVATGLIAGALMVFRALNQSQPMAPVDLMRIPLFALSIGTSVCSFLAQNFAFVALPFLIEYAFHRSPVETGLLLTPWSIAVAIMAPVSGRLADRFSSGLVASTGLTIMGVGLILLALLKTDASSLDIGWRMIVGGVGFAMFQTPNNRDMLGSAPPERAGSAGGMLATARLTGQTLGATLVALLFRLAAGPPSPKMLFAASVFAFLAAGVSWMKPGRRRIA